MDAAQKYIQDIYGKSPESLDEIAEACIAVISQKHEVTGFAWNIQYEPEISNSNEAPIGKKTNWYRRKHLPLGYPGFHGRVWIRFRTSPPAFTSSLFPATLTYVGTGGYGSYKGPWDEIAKAAYHSKGCTGFDERYNNVACYGWDYRFFIDDFPKFAEIFTETRIKPWEQEQLLETLKGNRPRRFHAQHSYQWNNSTIYQEDEAFLQKWHKYLKDTDQHLINT